MEQGDKKAPVGGLIKQLRETAEMTQEEFAAKIRPVRFPLLEERKETNNYAPGTIGEKIKALRKEKNLTQRELAYKAGIPLITLQQYERGVRKNPHLEPLKKIASVLNTSLAYLLGDIGSDLDFELERTICGFKVRDLVAFAQVCRENGVEESDLAIFAKNIEFAFGVVTDAIRKEQERALSSWLTPRGGKDA